MRSRVQESYNPNVPISAAEGAVGGVVVIGILLAGWIGRGMYEATHRNKVKDPGGRRSNGGYQKRPNQNRSSR